MGTRLTVDMVQGGWFNGVLVYYDKLLTQGNTMSLDGAPFPNLHEGALWAGPPYRALPSSSCLPGDRVESNSGVLASPGPGRALRPHLRR